MRSSSSVIVRGLAAAAFCFALFLSVAPARAADAQVSATDAAAIHKVVQNQLAAFQRDDGDAAFAYASPGIQEMFGNADNFMMMVRSGYQPVYRPRHVEFGAVDIEDGAPTQHVLLVGPDGVEVEALYFMERQPDGKWLINGCVLRPSYQA
jgi:hypothetical protein